MDSALLYVALALVVLSSPSSGSSALRRGAGQAGSRQAAPGDRLRAGGGRRRLRAARHPAAHRRRHRGGGAAGRRPSRSSRADPAGEVRGAHRRGSGGPAPVEIPEPAAGRLQRLRARLARSQNALGRGLLALLSRENIDEDTWDEVEETLLTADLGVAPTQELLERLRTRVKVEGTSDPVAVPLMLREELLVLVDPTMDRECAPSASTAAPASSSSSG